MDAKLMAVAMMAVGVATMGSGATGCQTATNEELAAMDRVGYNPLTPDDPVGGGTTNHVLPNIYQDHKYELLKAMDYALQAPSSHEVSSDVVNTGITSTADGRELLKTAVECALAESDYVTMGSTPVLQFDGRELMSTAAGWSTGALSAAQKEDVLRCVIARVNQSGVEVDIVMSGQNVTDKPGEEHHVDELVADAFWDVKITTICFGGCNTTINEYAWPVSSKDDMDVYHACRDQVTALEARVCDVSSSCGFTISSKATDHCGQFTVLKNGLLTLVPKCDTFDNGQYRPVVQTWVRRSDYVSVHNYCGLTPNPLTTTKFDLIPIFN